MTSMLHTRLRRVCELFAFLVAVRGAKLGGAVIPGSASALAPAAGPLAVDLSAHRRQAARGLADRSADRADGAGKPGLGLQADPRAK